VSYGVLIEFLIDGSFRRLLEFSGGGEFIKALRQIHRAAFKRAPRHLPNDGLGEEPGF